MTNINVIKRNGAEVKFNLGKIVNAVSKANNEVEPIHQLNKAQLKAIAEGVHRQAEKLNRAVSVEEIQNMVETGIMEMRGYEVAQKYVRYRFKRELARKANTTDEGILSLINQNNEELKQENSNKNPIINSTQRDYMAGEVSKDLTKRVLLPEDIVKAHEDGIIHFHDADYFAQKEHNCDLINLGDMMQNGTVISGTMIEKPHSFYTACNITTQVVAQVASNQYGGQSFTLSHLVPFVDISRKRIINEVKTELENAGISASLDQIHGISETRLKDEIKRGIQTIQYQLITLMTCNGQAPFVTMYMYLDEVPGGRMRNDLAMVIEEILNQRIQGVKNDKGVWITPAFPKLIYVLEDDNISESAPYWYLTELAAKCTAKRMVPDYLSEKKMIENKYPKEKRLPLKERIEKWGDERIWGVNPFKNCTEEELNTLQQWIDKDDYNDIDEETQRIIDAYSIDPNLLIPRSLTPMGCRSMLSADFIHYKTYGRFNQGVVTLNLIDVACSSDGDMEKFWNILDERLELCHRALRKRHERLLGTVSDVAPILWQYGAIARLKKGEVIDKLLYDNYSTISLGYCGLYEMCMRMIGKSHTTEEGKKFSLKVMQALNDACDKWKNEENIGYSVYGTPLESTTYKFAKCLQKRFGSIPNVTDRNYVTNSYHVHVAEPINAFKKLQFESEFQMLSPGGAISYIEVPNMQNNIPAVLSVMKFIYNNIMYAELNTKSDYCSCCNYDGEMQIIEDDYGKLIWECPNCGNRNQDMMSVARRTCGYIGTNYWNQGRTQEIRERYVHI